MPMGYWWDLLHNSLADLESKVQSSQPLAGFLNQGENICLSWEGGGEGRATGAPSEPDPLENIFSMLSLI